MYGTSRSGELNPFFGQKHSENTKIKLRSNKPKRVAAIEKTVSAKYGVTNVRKLESVKAKGRQTSLEKYGCENFTQTEQGRAIISNIRKANAQRSIYLEIKDLYKSLGRKIPNGTYILADEKLLAIRQILSNKR